MEIRFRIIVDLEDIFLWSADKFDEEGDIEGFFELDFSGYSYGYYHSGPLGNDEKGFDLLTNWFERLIKLVLYLNTNDYVAISDIESYNTWIEFVKKDQNTLKVSIIKNSNKSGLSDIVMHRFSQYKYSDWRDVTVLMEDFKNELIHKTELYIEQIRRLNEHLIESKRIKILDNLLDKIK
ncbi:hypothetical protein D3C76_493480 [compost metagenome]